MSRETIAEGEPVRLSAWVFFVEHGDRVGIHHALSGSEWRVERAVADQLRTFAGFRPITADMASWIDVRVLVRPFMDPLIAPHDAAEEGQMGAAWNDWYWKREVEAERDYRWQGEVVLKMPDDLFLYQELIFDLGVRTVLEIGYGRGGGLWFFSTVLAMRGGGHVIGVEIEPPTRVPDFSRCAGVHVDLLQGDAHAASTVAAVKGLRGEFDLVVVDADPAPSGKLHLLAQWTPLVSEGGILVLEDLGSPACLSCADDVVAGLDLFLLGHRHFGVYPPARRFPTSKTARGAFQRLRP